MWLVGPTDLGVGGKTLLHGVCQLLQRLLLLVQLLRISLAGLQGQLCSVQLSGSSPSCSMLLPALLCHLCHSWLEVLQRLPLQGHRAEHWILICRNKT